MHAINVSVMLQLSRRKRRLGSMDGLEPRSDPAGMRHAAASECNALMLSHVVHVSPDSRKVHLHVASMVQTAAGSSILFATSVLMLRKGMVTQVVCLPFPACHALS